MPNQLRQQMKMQMGLPETATDLKMYQTILETEPENISAMSQIEKLIKAGKEWMDAKGLPVD